MGRYKCQVKVRRDRGVTGKQDTPVKPTLSRRNTYTQNFPEFRKLPPMTYHEAIPEEPHQNAPSVRSAHPTLMSYKTIPSESVSHWSSPAVTAKENTSSPAIPALVKPGYQESPADHPTIHTTLSPKFFPCVATPDQEKMSVRPESISSSSMESDMTFSCDDDEEDCCSSSSSLPSPEIFRRESYVETSTFTVMEDRLGHYLYMKNSTLLDVSHAESIHKYHPPNLSTIIDGSSVLYEKKCEINPLQGPEAETTLKTVSLKPVTPSLNSGTKTPPKLTNRRPISYKKKVWFKSPIISEPFDAKCISAKNITPHAATETVRTASLAEEYTSDADLSKAGEGSFKEEALGLRVSLKRPEKRSPETAKFFDFETESDNDMFFQMMRERSARLRSVPLFPLTAVKPTNSLVL